MQDSAENRGFFQGALPHFRHKYFRDYSIYNVDMHPNGEANGIFVQRLKKQSLLNGPSQEERDKE